MKMTTIYFATSIRDVSVTTLLPYIFEVDGYSMFQTMSMPDVFCARWDGYRLTSLTHVRIPSLTA
ncbi:hypothetical protein NHG23_02295 [Aerococcaceae bacterium NML190073]|nr:hypothetical protein [Aerococcaceae bacterium NML190073]